MCASAETELIDLSRRLLDAIDTQDWKTYADLCDPTLTAFEPEAVGHLIAEMDFHEFYFRMESNGRPTQSTISSPHVRLLGETAVVTYVRLVQRVDEHGAAQSTAFEESRIWHKQQGNWRHVHFHRS
jgi:calcium/calmodulin-dependent protein kinase (CaM kinase) II